jgi:DNA-binding FrmR family transcriptional regulator
MGMTLAPEVMEDLRGRLRRAAGQVKAVERMLDEGRDCREVVTQLSAARAALEQVGFKLVSTAVTQCVSDPDGEGTPGERLDELEKLFLKLA